MSGYKAMLSKAVEYLDSTLAQECNLRVIFENQVRAAEDLLSAKYQVYQNVNTQMSSRNRVAQSTAVLDFQKTCIAGLNDAIDVLYVFDQMVINRVSNRYPSSYDKGLLESERILENLRHLFLNQLKKAEWKLAQIYEAIQLIHAQTSSPDHSIEQRMLLASEEFHTANLEDARQSLKIVIYMEIQRDEILKPVSSKGLA